MKRLVVAAMLLAVAPGASAQGGATHVLLISGLSAEPHFAKLFGAEAGAVFDAARGDWHVGDSDLVYLAEDPAADTRITAKSTRENVEASFRRLAMRTRAGDILLVLLIGHGAGELETSTVNLPGPDPTAADYAAWLVPFRAATVVFVNTASASGDFAKVLAAPNRIVVTATKTAYERNESEFGGFFAHALTSSEADADKDGKVSVAEAFRFASAQVARSYESTNRMLTEHAVMADSSGMATRIAFGGTAVSDDPRVAALMGERRVLERSVDSLRTLKVGMDSTRYEHDLEQLLLAVAQKTRAIRALQGGTP